MLLIRPKNFILDLLVPFSLLDEWLSQLGSGIHLIPYPCCTWKRTAEVKTSESFTRSAIKPWDIFYSLAVLMENSMDYTASQPLLCIVVVWLIVGWWRVLGDVHFFLYVAVAEMIVKHSVEGKLYFVLNLGKMTLCWFVNCWFFFGLFFFFLVIPDCLWRWLESQVNGTFSILNAGVSVNPHVLVFH